MRTTALLVVLLVQLARGISEPEIFTLNLDEGRRDLFEDSLSVAQNLGVKECLAIDGDCHTTIGGQIRSEMLYNEGSDFGEDLGYQSVLMPVCDTSALGEVVPVLTGPGLTQLVGQGDNHVEHPLDPSLLSETLFRLNYLPPHFAGSAMCVNSPYGFTWRFISTNHRKNWKRTSGVLPASQSKRYKRTNEVTELEKRGPVSKLKLLHSLNVQTEENEWMSVWGYPEGLETGAVRERQIKPLEIPYSGYKTYFLDPSYTRDCCSAPLSDPQPYNIHKFRLLDVYSPTSLPYQIKLTLRWESLSGAPVQPYILAYTTDPESFFFDPDHTPTSLHPRRAGEVDADLHSFHKRAVDITDEDDSTRQRIIDLLEGNVMEEEEEESGTEQRSSGSAHCEEWTKGGAGCYMAGIISGYPAPTGVSEYVLPQVRFETNSNCHYVEQVSSSYDQHSDLIHEFVDPEYHIVCDATQNTDFYVFVHRQDSEAFRYSLDIFYSAGEPEPFRNP